MIVKSSAPHVTTSPLAGAPMDKKNVQQIFPLTAMQRALYWRRLAGHGTDPGFLQVRFDLHGELDASRFEQAWNSVVDRHASLRMSIVSRENESPLLMVWCKVLMPFTSRDWRSLELNRGGGDCPSYEQDDRSRGLDVSRPPGE